MGGHVCVPKGTDCAMYVKAEACPGLLACSTARRSTLPCTSTMPGNLLHSGHSWLCGASHSCNQTASSDSHIQRIQCLIRCHDLSPKQRLPAVLVSMLPVMQYAAWPFWKSSTCTGRQATSAVLVWLAGGQTMQTMYQSSKSVALSAFASFNHHIFPRTPSKDCLFRTVRTV